MHEMYLWILVHNYIDIVDLFERELKRINPGQTNFNYRVEDIFNYIDSMAEFNLLVYV